MSHTYERLEWMDDALCAQVSPEPYFVARGESMADSRKICNSCEVQEQCLAYATETNQKGFWGGKTERERTKLRRNLGHTVANA
jgi:WhiB family transcriptional regulator, redox-sensing transcriptional regulator